MFYFGIMLFYFLLYYIILYNHQTPIALNVYKIGCVQRKRKECAEKGESAFPKIHAFVFDPKVGLLHKLPINFKKTIAQYKDVYNLY